MNSFVPAEKVQWSLEEWEQFRKKLENLSLDDIRKLADATGLEFTGGNESVQDSERITAKEEFILALDEVDKEKLLAEYDKIVKLRNSY